MACRPQPRPRGAAEPVGRRQRAEDGHGPPRAARGIARAPVESSEATHPSAVAAASSEAVWPRTRRNQVVAGSSVGDGSRSAVSAG